MHCVKPSKNIPQKKRNEKAEDELFQCILYYNWFHRMHQLDKKDFKWVDVADEGITWTCQEC